jgi:hypothetical protein
MIKKASIQLKAAILLFVFGLNTIVGFACSVGFDMGFNTHHHDEEATEVTVHIHADGKEHHHPVKAEKHHHSEKGDSKKDNCCNDSVVKLSQLDQAVPQSAALIAPLYFSAFITSYNYFLTLFISPVIIKDRYFARNYHPPISDIRIALQSFQI